MRQTRTFFPFCLFCFVFFSFLFWPTHTRCYYGTSLRKSTGRYWIGSGRVGSGSIGSGWVGLAWVWFLLRAFLLLSCLAPCLPSASSCLSSQRRWRTCPNALLRASIATHLKSFHTEGKVLEWRENIKQS